MLARSEKVQFWFPVALFQAICVVICAAQTVWNEGTVEGCACHVGSAGHVGVNAFHWMQSPVRVTPRKGGGQFQILCGILFLSKSVLFAERASALLNMFRRIFDDL